jgi:putative inorganic carbon (HCO3(-)) transporter
LRLENIRFSAEKGLFWLLLLLLIWVPIPLGSNRTWAWTVLELWAYGLAGAWLILWVLRKAGVSEALAKSWPALALLGAWILYNALHIVPLPIGLVAALSPESARMQGLTDAAGIARQSMTLSVDAHASKEALLKGLAYTCVFFLVVALCNSRSRVAMLARILVSAAVLHSIYAVILHLENAQGEFFGTMFYHGDSASGTYPNRNHFAGYLEMTLAIGIGMLIAGLSDRTSDSWKRFFSHLIDWILSPKMVLRLALCVLVIALTTTHSRMGNTAFFASLLVTGMLGIALSRHATRNTIILLVSLVAIDLFIVGSWFGVEKLARRMEQTTMTDVQVREEPAAHAIPLIKDYVGFGSGPGTFYVTFPRYRPATVVNFYDYAHNEYVQFASESGIIGLGLLGTLVVLTLGVALKAHLQRRDPLMRGMSFACVMGVISILIHSWVDFNLQIPANATYFMVLLALGWISLNHDRRTLDVPRRKAADA